MPQKILRRKFNMAKFNNPTKVIKGVKTRLSYANVWHPKAINGGAPKYSVSLDKQHKHVLRDIA